ncbi:type VII secretion system-associated protein [Streptomyces sp. NPDC002181]|uniref:type VII secretion system-associated protein n=1 Tax=Streptomyces sp. NPDC002181 TaxID=3364635 RepID=UPI0036B9C59E
MAKDPEPLTGKLGMDKAGLQGFLDYRVTPMTWEFEKITQDDPTFGPSMASLVGQKDRTPDEEYDLMKPLAIGFMASGDNLHSVGRDLNDGVAKTANSLVKIFDQDARLFTDVVSNLETTITTLLNTQGASLADVDGQAFLDAFEDVSDNLSSGSGGKAEDSSD